MKQIVLLILKIYKSTRFLRIPSCRFYPSCSDFMSQGIERHGLTKGLWLGIMRLCRCHPLHDGGIDEVPVEFKPLTIFEQISRRSA